MTKRDALVDYLHREVAPGETRFLKSKHIAEHTDLSPQEIGQHFRMFEGLGEIHIEKWAYSKATTWKITRELNGRLIWKTRPK